LDKPSKGKTKTKGFYHLEEWVIDNECKIYTVRGAKKPNWHVRIRLPPGSEKTYYRKSLKTTDRGTARFQARKQYHSLLSRAEAGLSLERITFPEAWELYKHHRALQGFNNIRQTKIVERFFYPYFVDHLGETERVKFIDQLTSRHIGEYFMPETGYRARFWEHHPPVKKADAWGRMQWTNKSPNKIAGPFTLNYEKYTLSGLLEHAKKLGHLMKTPEVPPVANNNQQLGSNTGFMDKRTYTRICRRLWELSKPRQEGNELLTKGGRRNRLMQFTAARLRAAFLLMTATGIRVQECNRLRWSMVTLVKRRGRYYTRLELPGSITKGKWNGSTIVPAPRIAFSFNGDIAYRRLHDEWGQAHCPTYGNENGLIFPSSRDEDRPALLHVNFKSLLAKIDTADPNKPSVAIDMDGNRITLRSARHFFVTQRLAQGCPASIVARNCGHTLDTMNRIYSRLMMDDLVEWLQHDVDGESEATETRLRLRHPDYLENVVYL